MTKNNALKTWEYIRYIAYKINLNLYDSNIKFAIT